MKIHFFDGLRPIFSERCSYMVAFLNLLGIICIWKDKDFLLMPMTFTQKFWKTWSIFDLWPTTSCHWFSKEFSERNLILISIFHKYQFWLGLASVISFAVLCIFWLNVFLKIGEKISSSLFFKFWLWSSADETFESPFF